MPAKLGRLRKGVEFDTVFEKGSASSGPLLVVRARAADDAGGRWGFAVGKRMAPSAVTRNLARRRMREAARGFQVPPGFDFVVVARAPALTSRYDALAGSLAREVERAVRKASA